MSAWTAAWLEGCMYGTERLISPLYAPKLKQEPGIQRLALNPVA